MKKHIIVTLLLIVFFQYSLNSQVAPGDLKITYISNAGFLFATSSHKVLVDALFSNGNKSFKSVTDNILKGKDPFNNINVYLLTHYHMDHCNPQMVNDYLAKYPRVAFVTSKPAISFINGTCYEFILLKKQFAQLTPEVNQSVSDTVNGIPVKAFGLKHNAFLQKAIDMNESMLNLSFIFVMDGIRVFHSGDIKTDAIRDYMAKNINWTDKVDVAALCYGLFDSGLADLDYILQTLKPKFILIMHVPAEKSNECASRIEILKARFPDIIFMKNSMDSRTITIPGFKK